jgi:hypothetical protein
MMLNNLRNPLPRIENAGEMGVDRVKKAANCAAHAAKDATSQFENWVKDGYGSARDAVKAKPFISGAASLGLGALIGGLYALWRRSAAEGQSVRNPLAVRARTKQSLRAITQMNDTGSVAKRKSKRTKRIPRATNA